MVLDSNLSYHDMQKSETTDILSNTSMSIMKRVVTAVNEEIAT